jgi:hypothetical protein
LAEQLETIRDRLKKEGIDVFDFGETDVDESWLDQTPEFDRMAMTRLGYALKGPTTTTTTTPSKCCDEEAAALQQTRPMIRNVFAVISGERHYAWGVAREDCRHHSDMTRLQTVVFRSLGRLTERTNVIHQAWRMRQQKQQQQQEMATSKPWNGLWEKWFSKE